MFYYTATSTDTYIPYPNPNNNTPDTNITIDDYYKEFEHFISNMTPTEATNCTNATIKHLIETIEPIKKGLSKNRKVVNDINALIRHILQYCHHNNIKTDYETINY